MNEPENPMFAILLLRLSDGRILIQADDSQGKSEPVKIAVRKESIARERLSHWHADDLEAIMSDLSKTNGSRTVYEAWTSLENLRRFWNA